MKTLTLYLLHAPGVTNLSLDTLPWSASTLQRLEEMSDKQQRCQLQMGRLLIAEATRLEHGAEITVADIEEQPGKCPHPNKLLELYPSLSHSGHWLGAVVANGIRCGLDLELSHPRDVLNLARHAFSHTDRAWVEHGPPNEQAERFYQLWTLREACYKAGLRPEVAGPPDAQLWTNHPQAASGAYGSLHWAVAAEHPISIRLQRLKLQPGSWDGRHWLTPINPTQAVT